jgi:serine/threonine protein phosphatase 1
MKLTTAFRRLFPAPSARKPIRARPHLVADTWPAALYAVGDVHGCLAQLLQLERKIVADASATAGEKWIVMLGDYVDRGPDSAGVLDHLLARPPAGFQRFCLAGNHETMMLDFLSTPRPDAAWLEYGGIETLASYGLDIRAMNWHNSRATVAALASAIPEEHIDFIRKAPLYLSLPGTLMVHAGIRPGMPLEDQSEQDLLWIREPFLDAAMPEGPRVVHGHTPASEPVVTPFRIAVDTGAYATGRLTAAKLTPDSCSFISVGAAA